MHLLLLKRKKEKKGKIYVCIHTLTLEKEICNHLIIPIHHKCDSLYINWIVMGLRALCHDYYGPLTAWAWLKKPEEHKLY